MRLLGLLSSVLLTGAIVAIVWGNQSPGLADAGAANWNMFNVAMALFAYLFIQAAAAHTPPEYFNVWHALDIVFSVVPLFTAVTAYVASLYFQLNLDGFQQAFVILSGTVALIDLLLIWVFMKEPKRPQPDAHPLRDAARRR